MLVRKVAINEEQVRVFLENLFEEDLHARRMLSLTHTTLGLVHAGSLSVHAHWPGPGMGPRRRAEARHQAGGPAAIQRAVDVWQLTASWVPYVLAERTQGGGGAGLDGLRGW